MAGLNPLHCANTNSGKRSMIYDFSQTPESFQTNLRIDILISMIKSSIKRFMEKDNYNKFENPESVFSEIELLCNEINKPVGLKYFVDKYKNLANVNDENVKSYLYSMLAPSKLQSLRNWVRGDINMKENSKYNVEVILHILLDPEINRETYANQLLSINNEQGACNLNFGDFINLLKKSLEKLFYNRGKEYVIPEVIISLLEFMKREIFYSNSTRLFKHEPDDSDILVKDYLHSVLSPEKLNALRVWLNNNERILISNDRELGIISSIYVPDWNGS
ncbi:MAG: hypothetical protein IT244_00450 [Bacteroidia bacterium]|nr:hypothetical protein [Bacteroidia bacterium]